jgi:predicted DNA-binding transcriptional regulator YafY
MTKSDAESKKTQLRIEYTNWRGETSVRTIVPLNIWFGSTEWHPVEQWLMRAVDIEKDAERDFALTDIKKWLD